ncbi:MAG TPA: SDR family oxidoreductase [Actinomycetota bacterium]|nr:SDR family oxidoreductase [Actinomycetota bacterium]
MGSWVAGRTAVVTGASRGIGLGCAEALAEAGARVVMAARDGDALEAEASRLTRSGGLATAVACDVSVPDDVRRLFEAAPDVRILVCAAGVLHPAPVEDTTEDEWRETLDVNVGGVFRCCREAFPRMRAVGGGRIVTFSSLGGMYGTEKFPGLAAYTTSKHAVVGLTEALAVEGRDHAISVVCVSPGAVDTEMLRRAAPHLRPGLGPHDVGRFVRALLDEDLAPASGANIPLFSNR